MPIKLNGSGSGSVALNAPANTSGGSDISFTLPTADGTSGQVLQTNGSGALSFASASSDKITEGNTTAEVIDTGSDGRFVVTTEGTERLRVDSSGRLLVGTTSSSATTRFEVYGQSSSSTEQAIVRFGRGSNPSGAGDHLTTIQFAALTSGGVYSTIEAQCDGTPGTNDYPGRLVFSTTADGAAGPTERMRINQNGFVTMNTTTPLNNAILTVKNGSYATIASERIGSGGEYHILFYNGIGLVGSITTSGTSTAYNTSSDYRLKENITAVTDGITRLQQLKPSRFNFVADPDTVVDGFIAHEVQEVVPEAISGERDAVDENGEPVYQGIDQSKLVPLLTAALQEAIGKIETLETANASLEARLTALEGGAS